MKRFKLVYDGDCEYAGREIVAATTEARSRSEAKEHFAVCYSGVWTSRKCRVVEA
jgi:hypothetical protein